MTTQMFSVAFICLISLSSLAAGPSQDDAFKASMKNVSQKYSELILKSYETLLNDTQNAQKAIKEFTQKPSSATQEMAKEAWKKMRLSYSPTEPFRFYAGPIDAPEKSIEPLMNAWPIDEGYIDYVQGNLQSGIINHADKYPVINKEALVAAHEKDGERNVATGYHAVEFLLWGQDLDLASNGKRSFEDYIESKNSGAQRRAQYLLSAMDLLVEQSNYLVQSWQPGAAYPKSFASETAEEQLRRLLTGMTSLSADEMAGERLTVALEKHDQENEQDCFSDFTLNDLAANQEGILKVYNQTGLKEMFASKDKSLEAKIAKQLQNSSNLLRAIPGPFDKVITEMKMTDAKKKVQKAIESLQKQAHLLSQMAKKFKVELNVQ